MVFLVVRFEDNGNYEVVPNFFITEQADNKSSCFWPRKSPQEKARRGEMFKVSWAQYNIKKISVHCKYLLFSTQV